MRRLVLLAAVLAVLVTAGVVRAQEYPEKWVMAYGKSITTEEKTQDFINLINDAAKLGYTHIFFDEVYGQMLCAMPPSYFEHIKQVRAAADKAGVKIVPGIFSVGYSWRVIWYDNNLAAGIPARDVPFVVKDHVALADPSAAPVIENAGFEMVDGMIPAWTPAEGAQVCVSADTTEFHSGASSLKMTDFDKLPMSGEGRRRRTSPCQVTQTIAVEPFKYYRLTIWRKTSGLEASGSSIGIVPTDHSRNQLSYTNFEIDPVNDWEDFVTRDSDWKEFQLTFNTLEATSIDITVGIDGARAGAVWWDDLKIVPAGLANLLRGDTKPFVVKSADGAVTYEEGRDFIYVKDVLMGMAPMPAWLSYVPPGGSFDIWHEGPAIRLTPDSRIQDGEKLLVSYYHPHIVYGHQVVGSLTDPQVFGVFDQQMRTVVDAWGASAYFMGYDEIRCGGWEKQPGGTDYKVAKLLADHATRAVQIAKKYAPDAKLYIWSDMFDPFHNARKIDGHGYYLCNGDFEGSWEGLPSEVRIIKWGGGGADCLKFFADRGHEIVISSGNRRAVESWKENAKDVPQVLGFMYTNWQSDFGGLPDFMAAIEGKPAVEEQAADRP